MGKGTPAFGKHNNKLVHVVCRRCGNRSYHLRKKRCASCGFGRTASRRVYAWNKR